MLLVEPRIEPFVLRVVLLPSCTFQSWASTWKAEPAKPLPTLKFRLPSRYHQWLDPLEAEHRDWAHFRAISFGKVVRCYMLHFCIHRLLAQRSADAELEA